MIVAGMTTCLRRGRVGVRMIKLPKVEVGGSRRWTNSFRMGECRQVVSLNLAAQVPSRQSGCVMPSRSEGAAGGSQYDVHMRIERLDVAFRAGKAFITFTTETGSIMIKSHWLNDRFAELITCVDLLANGAETASCRWQGPVNDGHCIDFVTDPEGGLNLAIHEFKHPEGFTSAEIWSAERGPAVLVCHQSLHEFVLLFTAAIRRVRLTFVEADGLLKEYPRPFPFSLFEQLERSAAPMGYQPTPMAELSEVDPDPA